MSKPKYVYVAESGEFAKVGVSIHPARRMEGLRTSYGIEWNLAGYIVHEEAWKIEWSVICRAMKAYGPSGLFDKRGAESKEIFRCGGGDLWDLVHSAVRGEVVTAMTRRDQLLFMLDGTWWPDGDAESALVESDIIKASAYRARASIKGILQQAGGVSGCVIECPADDLSELLIALDLLCDD